MSPKPKTILFSHSVEAMTQKNMAWFIYYDILMYTVGSQVDKPERPAYFVSFLFSFLNHSNETSLVLVIYYVVSDVQSHLTKQTSQRPVYLVPLPPILTPTSSQVTVKKPDIV
jgi:hypothetical protein